MNRVVKVPEDLPELISYFMYFLSIMEIIPENAANSSLTLCKERLKNRKVKTFFQEIENRCGVRLENDEELTAISLALHLFAKNRNW